MGDKSLIMFPKKSYIRARSTSGLLQETNEGSSAARKMASCETGNTRKGTIIGRKCQKQRKDETINNIVPGGISAGGGGRDMQ